MGGRCVVEKKLLGFTLGYLEKAMNSKGKMVSKYKIRTELEVC